MFATTPAGTIAYDDQGSGDPILFVHGFPLNRTSWNPQLALADTHRVLTIDLPGHGESPAADGGLSMDRFADAVAALLDARGVDRAVICGLSMGGYVTYAFYRKYPERVRALILADTRAVGDSPEAAAGRRALAQRVAVEGTAPVVESMHAKMFADGIVPDGLGETVRAIMASTPAPVVAADLEALASRPDSTPTLRAIRVPTLVVHGDHDVLIPPADGTYQADRIPGSTLEIIAGAGHLSNLEMPDAFNALVADYVAKLP